MLQEFVEQVEKAARSVMEEMHTAIPGKITAFNVGTGFATVKPYGTYTTDSGRKMAYPTVTEVPVIIPQSQVNDMAEMKQVSQALFWIKKLLVFRRLALLLLMLQQSMEIPFL